MGVHVCAAKGGLAFRLTLLALLHAVLLQLAAARTMRQRFDLGRRAATPGAATADVSEGSEITLVLKPPETADERPSKDAVEDLKFAVANEAMRPLPLQRFLSSHGMNPKARLPPLRTITPGSGAAVPLGHTPIDMEAAPASTAPAPPPAVPQVPQQFYPAGYDTTAPPAVVGVAQTGDLRQSLTTPPPPFDAIWSGPFSNDLLGYGLGSSHVSSLEECKNTCRFRPPCQAIQYSATEQHNGNNCFIFEYQRRDFVAGNKFRSFKIWKYNREADTFPPAPAPAAAPGPAVASTTPMMMMRTDAYEVGSVRKLTNMVRDENGDMLECSDCKCVKHINGGIQNVEDPTCE